MKKILFFLFFICISLITPQTNAMQGAASRTTGQFAKRSFSGFMTTLHWTLAAGQSFALGIQKAIILINEDKVAQKFDNANEQVTNFIRKEIQLSPNYHLHVKE